jgi:signal transduction histidine kinase
MKGITSTLDLCAVVTIMIVTSSCMALNKDTQQRERRTALARIESLSGHISRAVTDVAGDIAPVLTEVGTEVFREVNSDMPAVTAELQSQMSHLSSVRKPQNR